MKTSILVKTLIIAFSLLANTIILFSQDLVVPKDSKCPRLIVTPLNQNVTASAGTTAFKVDSNIEWTASSDQAWCTVTPAGYATGTITAVYQANTGTTSRIAAITVSGSGVNNQVVTVTQVGTSPALIVTPLNQNVTSSSGTTAFAVASNLAWSSSSNQAWCTVTPSGTGNGTITAAYQANTGAGSRIATITVTGPGVSNQVVTVTQAGTAASLIVTPLNQNVASSAGTTNFAVASNIAWTSSSAQAWCTVTAAGTGNGTITATFADNTGTNSRIATITVKGLGVNDQVVTVTQSGTAPSLIVTPLNQNVTYSLGTTAFTVASNLDWTSSGNQTWCTVTPSGIGNGTITATFQENTGTSTRIATITVKGPGVSDQVVTVTQSGLIPSLIVTPLNQNVTSPAGMTSFNVASNIAWTASGDQAWCTVTPSGTGNGTITATYQENTGTGSRIATITVMGSGVSNQVVTVTQAGAPQTLTVTPPNRDVTSPSGTTSFDVVSNISWTAASDQAWCTVTPSGTGNGTITAAYQANTGSASRVATITITGSGVSNQVVTVTQDELIAISYSGMPWCISGGIQNVTLSGSSGGTYSAQPEGLSIDPLTGSITLGTSAGGSYTVKYSLEKPGGRVLEASAQVSIHLSVVPEISIKWGDVVICSNVGDLFSGYQWYNGTTAIPGATEQFYLTTKIAGVYTVEAVDKNGCKAMSNEISLGGAKSLLVYPNPARTSFNISIKDVPEGDARIRIINASGTEVMNFSTVKSDFDFSLEISTGNLEKGFYFVHVMINDVSLYSEKIMVIK